MANPKTQSLTYSQIVMARCRRVFSPRHIGASFLQHGYLYFVPVGPRPAISSSVSLLLRRPGTPTPTPPAARPAIRSPGATTPAAAAQRRGTGAAGIPLARRRAHKGKVDVHGLVQQLGAVGAVDGGAGLLEGRVLDQRVALAKAERGLARPDQLQVVQTDRIHTLT